VYISRRIAEYRNISGMFFLRKRRSNMLLCKMPNHANPYGAQAGNNISQNSAVSRGQGPGLHTVNESCSHWEKVKQTDLPWSIPVESNWDDSNPST
jgi:hypothetical protein